MKLLRGLTLKDLLAKIHVGGIGGERKRKGNFHFRGEGGEKGDREQLELTLRAKGKMTIKLKKSKV